MLDKRAAASSFAVAYIIATTIGKAITVYCRFYKEIRLFIPPCVKFLDVALDMLLIVKVFKDSIGEREAALGILHSEVVNDTAFTYPSIITSVAKVEYKTVLGTFRSLWL